MSAPYGFFLTWTTYGSWLPGDTRGWVDKHEPGVTQAPNALREGWAGGKLSHPPVVLTAEQRTIIEQTIRDHCERRGWELHAVNARTNHVHVVLSSDREPDDIMDQLKAWSSRRLNVGGRRGRWWTHDGSTRWLNTESSFWRAVEYVTNYQD